MSYIILATVVWLPVSIMFINPGWGTLMLFMPPYFMIPLVPLLLLAANSTPERKKSLPGPVFAVELAFCILWASLGFFYVNGGDTTESIGSILSDVFGGLWGREFLIQLSPMLLQLAAFMAFALLPFIFLYKENESRTVGKLLPAGLTVGLLAVALSTPFMNDTRSKQETADLSGAMTSFEQNVMSPAGAQNISAEVSGEGLSGQLACDRGYQCSAVTKSWVVPVDSNKDWKFIWDAIQEEGYRHPDPVFPCRLNASSGGKCSTWGLKPGSEVFIEIKVPKDEQIPKQNVTPKEWRLVEVKILPYPDDVPLRENGEIHE